MTDSAEPHGINGAGDPRVQLETRSTQEDIELVGTQTNVVTREDVPPDGGYGWVCTACVFLINAHTWGVNSVCPKHPSIWIVADSQIILGMGHLPRSFLVPIDVPRRHPARIRLDRRNVDFSIALHLTTNRLHKSEAWYTHLPLNWHGLGLGIHARGLIRNSDLASIPQSGCLFRLGLGFPIYHRYAICI